MADNGSDLPWTDEQWATVQRTAQDAARKARVASSFLPLVGPLPPGQAYVPKLTMSSRPIPGATQPGQPAELLEVDDVKTTSFITVFSNVYLTSTQAEEPQLSAALDMVCRAAVLVGRLEDAYIFNGQLASGGPPIGGVPAPPVFGYHGGDGDPGLLNAGGPSIPLATIAGASPEDKLVGAVVAGIQTLEGNGHYGPFACVLGDTLYQVANTPNQAPPLTRPRRLIIPLLAEGPFLRSSSIPSPSTTSGWGVVVALAGSPVDLVVASDVHVSYVQRTIEPRYVLRVSERFVLRIKQPQAICTLE